MSTLLSMIVWSDYLGKMTWDEMERRLAELNGPYERGHQVQWRLPSTAELKDASLGKPNEFCGGDSCGGDGRLLENAGDYWVGPETRRTAGWFAAPGRSTFGNGSDGTDAPHNVRFVSFRCVTVASTVV